MDNFSLFAANAVISFVLAVTFFIASRAANEGFCRTWGVGNGVITLALFAFMFESALPDFVVVTVPNGLLVLGMSLHWYGARQFEERRRRTVILWVPAAAFVAACVIPFVYGSYATVYTIVNVLLAGVTQLTALQYLRGGDGEKSLSRWGLVGAYTLLAASFAVRAGQGVLSAQAFGRGLPDDLLLAIHLIIALLFLAASGALSLSMAYERDAARLFRLATRDALTGLLTRRALEDRMQDLAAHGQDGQIAVMIIDLDHFKQVNDLYGHAAGDETLRACAQAFTEVLGETGLIARWGGEEFVAVVKADSVVEAHAIAERMRVRIRKLSILHQHRRISTSVSVGLCHSSSQCAFGEMLRRADAALYAAKTRGRNRAEYAAA